MLPLDVVPVTNSVQLEWSSRFRPVPARQLQQAAALISPTPQDRDTIPVRARISSLGRAARRARRARAFALDRFRRAPCARRFDKDASGAFERAARTNVRSLRDNVPARRTRSRVPRHTRREDTDRALPLHRVTRARAPGCQRKESPRGPSNGGPQFRFFGALHRKLCQRVDLRNGSDQASAVESRETRFQSAGRSLRATRVR